MKTTLTLVVVALSFGLGAAVERVTSEHHPSCPQEDSCTVDYHHGSWHVSEVTP